MKGRAHNDGDVYVEMDAVDGAYEMLLKKSARLGGGHTH